MELVRKKKVQAVIAVRLDRLFRDTIDALTVTREFDRLGCAVVLLDMAGGVVDTGSPAGRMMIALMSSFAEMERATIKARVRSVLAHKASKGERTSRFPPIGYSFGEGGMLVPNAAEQNAVSTMKRLHSDGYTASKIATLLNKHKVPARGVRWHASTVASVVSAA
jgi:DNA invertase Pin-like site-specific DNA recombinase